MGWKEGLDALSGRVDFSRVDCGRDKGRPYRLLYNCRLIFFTELITNK